MSERRIAFSNGVLTGMATGLSVGAHAGQVRKYTGEPYHNHPMAVEMLLKLTGHSAQVRAAGMLHDVLEDTALSYKDLVSMVGKEVAGIVRMVTDVSILADGNRATRKAMERKHLSRASPAGKSVKLADLIDNASSIIHHDPKFAKVFMNEMRELLKVLREGNRELYAEAEKTVVEYFEELEA